jgi:hypothetical protein
MAASPCARLKYRANSLVNLGQDRVRRVRLDAACVPIACGGGLELIGVGAGVSAKSINGFAPSRLLHRFHGGAFTSYPRTFGVNAQGAASARAAMLAYEDAE